MGAPPNHDYPPSGWTTAGIRDALTTNERAFPIPRYDDQAIWVDIRNDSSTAPTVNRLLNAANTALKQPFPDLSATHYLRWIREEDITQNELLEGLWNRWRQLSLFALAECFEREGRYLDHILDAAWAICEQSTWKLTPSTFSEARNVEGLPVSVTPSEQNITLRSAETAKLLAEIDYVLGEQLHPALRERIRTEITKRIIVPFDERDDFSWMTAPTANHNAVNNGATIVCALYLVDEPERQARILAKAAHNLKWYLDSFDIDGCTQEGLGYWNYGMSHYVQGAANLSVRTGGAYDLCSPSIIEKIAQYPQKLELSPGHYPPFSDSGERQVMSPHVACWLGEQLQLPGVAARGRKTLEREQPIPEAYVQRFFGDTLRDLVWAHRVSEVQEPATPSLREYFRGFDWWIARGTPNDPAGVVIAAKGGHNGEDHNHNDCGSFVVHYRGESGITDLGCPIYHRDYFGEPGRYEYLVTQSLGHSVPYVNECSQGTGREYAAHVLDRIERDDHDSFELELADCYPGEAGLDSLKRHITLDRDTERITISDCATFADDAPGTQIESVLVSYFPMQVCDDTIIITGDQSQMTVHCSTSDVAVERLKRRVDMRNRPWISEDYPDVWRARILGQTDTGEPGGTAVKLDIEPSPLND